MGLVWSPLHFVPHRDWKLKFQPRNGIAFTKHFATEQTFNPSRQYLPHPAFYSVPAASLKRCPAHASDMMFEDAPAKASFLEDASI
jgi:hypothetical protein